MTCARIGYSPTCGLDKLCLEIDTVSLNGMCVGTANTLFILLSVYYVRVIGMNAFQLVLVGTAIEGTMFLLQIPTGILADTYGRRLSVIIGLFLVAICYVIEGAVPLFV